jgi:hypothetical protein
VSGHFLASFLRSDKGSVSPEDCGPGKKEGPGPGMGIMESEGQEGGPQTSHCKEQSMLGTPWEEEGGDWIPMVSPLTVGMVWKYQAWP